MKRLANTSWYSIGLLALTWLLVCVAIGAVAIWFSAHDLDARSAAVGGGYAAIRVGITASGVVVMFGPPLTLVILRLIAERFRTN